MTDENHPVDLLQKYHPVKESLRDLLRLGENLMMNLIKLIKMEFFN